MVLGNRNAARTSFTSEVGREDAARGVEDACPPFSVGDILVVAVVQRSPLTCNIR